MIHELLKLKQDQIKAFEEENWELVLELEKQVQAIMKEALAKPDDLEQNQLKLIEQFVSLHHQILDLANGLREENLKEMLHLQKGKSATKAYSNK